MNWFEFNEGRADMGDVIDFEPVKKDVEHVDSTTIVERVEMTDEMKAAFEAAGYTIEIGAVKDED